MQLAGGEALDRVSPDVVCDVNSPCENIIFTVIEWNEDLSCVADELDYRPEAKQHERTSLHPTQVTVVQPALWPEHQSEARTEYHQSSGQLQEGIGNSIGKMCFL